MPKLCSFGCAPSGVPMHCFPNADKFPERFRAWVNLVGGKLETADDYEYYQRKLVCDIHFTPRDRNRNNRLNALAVPSLHLHGKSASEPDISLVTQPATLHPTTNTGTSAGKPDISVVCQPSTSYPTDTSKEIAANLFNTGTSPAILISRTSLADVESQPSTSHANTVNPPSTGDAVMMEHSYFVSNKISAKCTRKVKSLTDQKIRGLRSEICRLRKKGQNLKARLNNAEKLSSNDLFQKITRNMTTPAKLFTQMQVFQTSKKPKGRRYRIDEKVLCLSMYKKSPKCYGLLSKFFTLPSAKAMKRLLAKIKIKSGINTIVFKKIKETVADKDTSDRLCSLIFDEMSITPHIHYNAQKDELQGFAEHGKKFADHVLVFMIKGIKENYKQPVAYYFTNSLKKFELKQMIKIVIKNVQDTGLIVLNTVCDQSTVNVSAITSLIEDTKRIYAKKGKQWRHDVFQVNKQTLIPLYDVPHLMKGIRNNLITKHLKYIINDEVKVMKWEYLEMLYAVDKSYGELRLLQKMTEEHVKPQKMNKMRVKTAVQTFSHSVAVATEHLTRRGDLPAECRQMIDIVILFDNLFDSLNSNTFHVPSGKMYRGPVRRNSPHHQLWLNAKNVLKTIKFIKEKKNGNEIRFIDTTVPSVKNFIKTIEGMEALWTILSRKYSFDAMLTRHFNQDPIENFFGNIRSYGARNNAPNSVAFESAFKALLLNNYNSPHSIRSNCENDSNACLQNLDFFLKDVNIVCDSDVPKEELIINYETLYDDSNEADAGQSNYVCGWVLTKCLKIVVKNCKVCRASLIGTKDAEHNSYIRIKEYNKNKQWLCYPSKELEKCFHDVQNVVTSSLTKNVPIVNIKQKIVLLTDILLVYPFHCPIHKEKLKNCFVDTTVNLLIYSWCRSINRILTGKISYDGEDETKIAAKLYYNKHKHNKNKK